MIAALAFLACVLLLGLAAVGSLCLFVRLWYLGTACPDLPDDGPPRSPFALRDDLWHLAPPKREDRTRHLYMSGLLSIMDEEEE